MLAAASFEVDVAALAEHPLVLLVLSVAATAAGWAIQRWWKARSERDAALKAIQQDLALIAPHFRPPEPGQPNTSVPGRLESLEHNARQMRQDFLEHMDAEMRKHDDHRRVRSEDRREFRSAAQRLHDRIDQIFELIKSAA